MPTIFNPNQNLDENGNPIPEVSNSTNSTVIDSGQSSQTKQAGAPTSSGSFTNLKSYLDANKDSQMGNQFAAKVGEVGDQAANTLTQSEQSVKSKVDSGKVNYNPDLVNKAINDPSKFVQDSNQVQQFQQQRDASYKGPKQFSDTEEFGTSQKAVEKARQTGEAAKTSQGRQALLGDFYARPDYYNGMKRLDNLIIQNDPNSRQQLAAAQEKINPLQNNFQSLGERLASYANQADQTTQQTRRQTRDALGLQDDGTVKGGAIGKLDKTVSDRLDARRIEYDRDVPAVSKALANADLTGLSPQQRAALGFDSNPMASNLDYLWNVKLNDPRFLKTVSKNNLNKSSVASKDEMQRLSALSQLAGIENTFAPEEKLAGTLDDEALFNYDTAGAIKAVEDAYGAAAMDRMNNWSVGIDQNTNTGPMKEIYDKYAPNGSVSVSNYLPLVNTIFNRIDSSETLTPVGKEQAKAKYAEMYKKPFEDRYAAQLASLQRFKK